jgi:hypothetical protein
MAAPVPQLKSRWFLAAAAAVVTSVLFLDFCNLMFACGCRSWWAGADAACNIHHANVPHCPLCVIGLAGSFAVWLAIVGTQSFVALRAGGGWFLRVLVTFAVFPIIGGMVGVALGIVQGYWT